MEAAAAAALGFSQPRSWIGSERAGPQPGGFARLSRRSLAEKRAQTISVHPNGASDGKRLRHIELKISCSRKKSGAFGMENLHESVDEALILKRKAQEVGRHLNERCIYLVGMMGSGKTTVGKILSEVLGYSFFDSDKLVEQAVGMSSVAEIFKQRSEAFFRDSESEVLRDLSSMHRLVVATGGGAVIRPINWRYMKQGITVWLDVPLEALARRIAAVGTDSRPLLHQESGDPYTKAFVRLSTLAEQRGEAYANADARVCLQHMADKKGHDDVCTLTPMDIAIEALLKIEIFLAKDAALRESSYFQGWRTQDPC